MALTKLPKNAIADDAVNADKIADGTIQNQDVQGSISNDKLENSSFTFNGTEVSLGASQSVITYLDWQAVQVADGSTQVNAESGKGYFLDTNAGVIEVFLPTSPSRGDVVGLVDYAGTFGTNQLIINTGGVNIDSTVGSEFKVTTNNAIVECVYVDAAKGWLVYLNQAAGTTPGSVFNVTGTYDGIPPQFTAATGGTVTESGDYKIHTFTGDGCFVVSQIGTLSNNPGNPAAGPNVVDYLVVAGGGGGSKSGAGNPAHRGAGGGAGGFRESHSTCNSGCYTASPLATPTGITITATTYPITVGAGGAGFPSPSACSQGAGSKGSDSIFSVITSAGGGGGHYGGACQSYANGGSGGGQGGGSTSSTGHPPGGGLGNSPPVSPPQGNPGGSGYFCGPGLDGSGGGGGGATGTGTSSPPSLNTQNPGGAGATTSINGTPTTYSVGGNGGSTPNANGGANEGDGGFSGGKAGEAIPGGAGGKGIVIIRYKFQ